MRFIRPNGKIPEEFRVDLEYTLAYTHNSQTVVTLLPTARGNAATL